MRRQRIGFTLVELLVVIFVLGILIALLLPAINAVRDSTRRMSCQSRLRQIGIAMESYLDSQKRYPWAAQLPSVTPQRPSVAEVLEPYLGGESAVFKCPNDEVYYPVEGISYEYSAFRLAGKRRREVTERRPSSEVFVIFDFETFHGARTQPGARNVLYADGHVEPF